MTDVFDSLAYLTGGLLSNPNITVTTHVMGDGTITKTPDLPWYHGEGVTFTAIAEEGSVFSHWDFDGTGSDPILHLTANRDLAVLAVFTSFKTINVNIDGGGTVVSLPPGDVGHYPENITVTLTAMPDENWRFAGWFGDVVSLEPHIDVITNRDYFIQAVFVAVGSMTLTIMPSGDGYTDPPPGVHAYPIGSKVLIKAVPNENWKFLNWIHNNERVLNKTKVVSLNESQIWYVYFDEIFRLNLQISGDGRVTPTPGTYEYTEAEYVTFEAAANVGWTFDHWEGDLISYENPVKSLISTNKNITAVFAAKQQELYCTVQGFGMITPVGTNHYSYGTIVPIEATPDPGWHFAFWLGNLTGSENPTQLTILGDYHILAVFEQD